MGNGRIEFSNEFWFKSNLLIDFNSEGYSEPNQQSVSGRNKSLSCSSQALCYGRVRSYGTHNSFASHDGNVIRQTPSNLITENMRKLPIFEGGKNPVL